MASAMAIPDDRDRESGNMTIFGHRILHQPLSHDDYVSLVLAARRNPDSNAYQLARDRGLIRDATEIAYYRVGPMPDGATVGQLYVGRRGSVRPCHVPAPLLGDGSGWTGQEEEEISDSEGGRTDRTLDRETAVALNAYLNRLYDAEAEGHEEP
jgi:hypothetical protein